jgi:hypothetical protein
MPCPYLKEVVMLYCDAYPLKKMVPLDKLVSAEPCLARGFGDCPLFRRAAGPPEDATPEAEARPGKEVLP